MKQIEIPLLNVSSALCALLATSVFSVSLANAQAPSAEETDGLDAFELSPFEVSSDANGYVASNSISATGINVPILDLPMPIDVLTSEFISDTGAIDLNESLQYTAGVFSTDYYQGGGANRSSTGGGVGSNEKSPSAASSPDNPFTNTFNIRGFNVPTQQRNGFRVGGSIAEWGITLGGLIEPVNVDRIEVVRGPQSLLYGVSVISGVVNVIAKRPLPEAQQSIGLTYGSDNFVRATLDSTGPTTLLDNLNYRVTGAFRDGDHWTDFNGTHSEYLSAQLEYKPQNRMRFLVELQYGRFEQTGIGTQSVRDVTRPFDALTAYQYSDLEPVIFENKWGELYNWARDAGNWGASRFSDEAQTMPFGDYGPAYRISGPDTYYERKEWNGLLEANIPLLDNLDLSFGAFFASQEGEEFNVHIETIIDSRESLNVANDPEAGPYAVHFTYGDNDKPTKREQLLYARNDDDRVLAYWWTKSPREGFSQQYRAQLNYSFETPFFVGNLPASHRLFGGAQYTRDEFDFTTGTSFQQVFNYQDPFNDPVYFRSIFDFEPFQYEGETLAIPGARYMHTELWFTGFYGVYEGKFWDDRLTLILGQRRDIYNGEDKQYRRPGDRNFQPGELPWETFPDGSIDYNGVNKSYGFYSEEERPTFGRNFDEDIEADTTTAALGFKITDSINLYLLAAQGISPNTGLKDGNFEAIEPERTQSHEIGIKWDLIEGKLSGSLSVYRIERENAVWEFLEAPAPARWVGGTNESGSPGGSAFDPYAVLDGSVPITYSVHQSFFVGVEGFDGEGYPIRQGGALPDGVVDLNQSYNVLDYNKIRDPNHPLHAVIEEAFHAPQTSLFSPIDYYHFQNLNNSASASTRANTTFTDEATGIDLSLFYRPLPNWQITLSYSHTEREAQTTFDLLSTAWTDPATGETYQFGTEYDVWVYRLGREAFSDTDYSDGLDPSTHDSGGAKGLSLFFNAEDTFSLWNKFDFQEGLLEGLSIGGGVIYSGPKPTSIPIGGERMLSNQFPTPDLPERYVFNAMLSYKHRFESFDLRLQLNVDNLFDDTESTSEVTYADPSDFDQDGDELRRSVAYHNPRSFRFSALFSF